MIWNQDPEIAAELMAAQLGLKQLIDMVGDDRHMNQVISAIEQMSTDDLAVYLLCAVGALHEFIMELE